MIDKEESQISKKSNYLNIKGSRFNDEYIEIGKIVHTLYKTKEQKLIKYLLHKKQLNDNNQSQ